jgi:C-terminal processing protease CtpA/Prc
MIEPLHDGHTYIDAKSIHSTFEGHRANCDPVPSKQIGRIRKIIQEKYLRGGLRDYCKRWLHYGVLSDSIGYLRIDGFSERCEAALDDIFKDSSKLTGLVIDERINPGGSDVLGISIASRLANQQYLAYSKVTRNDIHDTGHRTAPQPFMVSVSSRPGFHGPVVLLIGPDSHSAAETFAMAVLDREPHITRVGDNTQGVFSDVLDRTLPNGWHFGLPNEIYLTKDGKAFDGLGVPPDLRVPVFSEEDLKNGRDSALDKAIELLGPAQNSGSIP